MMRKIIASPTHSPLPVRQHDWCAHYEGEEEAGNYGYGATEEEAIADFIENCAESHDERLGKPRPWFRGRLSLRGDDLRVYEGDGFCNRLVATFERAEEAAEAVFNHNDRLDGAAEPDLLNALKGLRAAVYALPGNWSPAMHEAYRAANSAIDRAEGIS